MSRPRAPALGRAVGGVCQSGEVKGPEQHREPLIGRIVIDDVHPRTPTGDYPAKAVSGEAVRVSADIFKDGHDILAARARWRPASDRKAAPPNQVGGWSDAVLHEVGNDRWEAIARPATTGLHHLVIEAWTDRWATWRHDVSAKLAAGDVIEVELQEGALLLEEQARRADRGTQGLLADAARALRAGGAPTTRLTRAFDHRIATLMGGPEGTPDLTATRNLVFWVDRPRALFGAWYELFPRSEGGLAGAAQRLAAVAEMGFDVVYLPPIHPIGTTARKGANATLVAGSDDPGSPWAIGSAAGDHTAIDPDLGTSADLDALVRRATDLGMEVALDYALQCSPDHPWVSEHPEWFHHRADGTIAYAENPPKKYQDIYPINFWPASHADRAALWGACLDILEHWMSAGIRIFRVDNPHTKPMAFWEWLISALRAEHPDVILLAEAFTRPKVMAKLAEVGFSQSYTYFTWRAHAHELADYVRELTSGPTAEYMRPSFWPNTPDILSGPLRNGPPAAFKSRLILAATLVPTYGIYSGYELCENQPASEDNEEYLYSEKYEVKHRQWDAPGSLAPWITKVNAWRRAHPALHRLRNITFHDSPNPWIMTWSKHTEDRSDVVLVVVNLDPWSVQESILGLDLATLGLPWDEPFDAVDELSGQSFTWVGPHPYVRLDPAVEVAHLLHLRRRL